MAHQADAKSMLDSRGLYTGATVHGVNPLLLVEKIIRERIFESLYWKEQAFGLNAATLLDRAVELTYIGGQYSNQKPTPFLCLAFKLLQLHPEREIVLTYLHDDEFKYLRALAAFYIRLTWNAVDIFKTLEPLMTDYRKLRVRGMAGWRLTHMDEFIDDLLTKERVCDIALPHIKTRAMLEDADELEPRDSALGSEIESEGEEEDGEEKEDEEEKKKEDGGKEKEKVTVKEEPVDEDSEKAVKVKTGADEIMETTED
ncbi:PRP38 family-domain-containing protein [Morchella snyderi]|nr:PRP38 family-domain-containing protein [Morchella snyderi]